MLVCKWEKLPEKMQVEEIREYYNILRKKNYLLVIKRIFDIVVSFLGIIVLSPLFLILSIAIKIDSKGPVFYRQVRITQYGKEFRIHKFRSMKENADQNGQLITEANDNRVTKVGKFIRKCKLDELSQLIDVLVGNMSFVGTRPEVPKYVNQYTNEMLATLLLPAGITSTASIEFAEESMILNNKENIDKNYIDDILPNKMVLNLKDIKKFKLTNDCKIIIKTLLELF